MIVWELYLEQYSVCNGGMLLGFGNLFGVCVFYIFQGNVDMFYRLYGINELQLIGKVVFLGCVCLINLDVIDFYD